MGSLMILHMKPTGLVRDKSAKITGRDAQLSPYDAVFVPSSRESHRSFPIQEDIREFLLPRLICD